MKPRILYVSPTDSSFMDVDQRILAEFTDLQVVSLEQDKYRLGYLRNCAKLFYKIITTRSIDIVVIWFADYHAAVATLASLLSGKRSLIFLGGYDAVRYPKLGMGVYCNPVRGFCAKLALRLTDRIIANHQALLESDNLYYDPCGHPEGVFRLIPNLQTQAEVVWNALSTSYTPDLQRSRIQQIVTVGTTPRYQDFTNKGFDLLCEAARLRPDWKFVFIGIRDCWMERLEREFNLSHLTNIKIKAWLPHKELFVLFEQSKVYAQPSISEGMPNALMEAMLCGCIPVGSPVAGIPEVMGKYGQIVGARDVYHLLEALETALRTDTDPKEISAYISDKFAITRRKDKLAKIINDLL
ncbi:MAG TPA: glycosyltransferase [Candidatus Cloacimonadota bacterium]|nr:glycosyltransferase [Candidatus Cloacimonadota bacterium]